jgi:hypothetical protein
MLYPAAEHYTCAATMLTHQFALTPTHVQCFWLCTLGAAVVAFQEQDFQALLGKKLEASPVGGGVAQGVLVTGQGPRGVTHARAPRLMDACCC